MRTLKYRPDIDGLRAVAVLLVLVFHFDLTGGGKSGFIGVDVFFVISGFLITSIILRKLDEGNFSLGAFYINRIRRLAPPLFAMLALTLVVGYLILFPDDYVKLAWQGICSQLYVANIYYWRTINYFGYQSDRVILLHTWSLAVEEQFYLVFPVLLMCAHRFARKYLWPVLGLIAIVSFVLNIAFVAAKPEAAFYLLPTRAWELLIGSFVYWISARWFKSVALNQICGLIGVLLIVIGVLGYGEHTHFPGYFALLPCLGAACLIASGFQGGSFASRLLTVPPMVYIGRISYSIYLVHWPINIFATFWLGDRYSWSMRFEMFGLSIVIAALLFHLVETPFREGKMLAGSRRMVSIYAAGVCASVVGFAVIVMGHGLPQRFPANVARIADAALDKPKLDPACEFDPKAVAGRPPYCLLGMKSKAPEWFVMGDSHAWAAYSALDTWLQDRGQSGIFSFRHGCMPIDGVDLYRDSSCRAFNVALARVLAETPTVTSVFLVARWHQGDEDVISESDQKLLSKDESTALFNRQFAATLRRIHAMGKRIVIWEPVPWAKTDVPAALARQVLSGHVSDLGISRSDYTKVHEFFFSDLNENRSLIEARFSPSEVLCHTGQCMVELGGYPLYFDGGHLTTSLSGFWARELEKQLGSVE